MAESHDAYCPTDLIGHIADIEAGWTLRKPWKARDQDEAEAENRQAIEDMLARWRSHGIEVLELR